MQGDAQRQIPPAAVVARSPVHPSPHRASIAAPSILQAPDLFHHQLCQLSGGAPPVEDLDAVRLEPDQSLESLLHAPPELLPHLLDPVERRSELPGAPGSLLGVEAQIE